MHPIGIFIISPEITLKSFLEEYLPAEDFEVTGCKPGEEITLQANRAQIAIIDRINERPDDAQKEISALKQSQPELPIIAISEHSSERDASVVRQGVFYYLAGYSEQKLLRVIRAAAGTISPAKRNFSQT